MIDVGGTTTDVGSVANKKIAVARRGSIQGVDISYEMSDVRSTGVGGSSIIAVHDGEITVGPESVGAAPGPACFGFGGTSATITDVNLLLGILDPATYLDGEMSLDAERSRAVIMKTVADPLGVSLEEALIRMEASYSSHLAKAFVDLVSPTGDTTLAAFGGGGPMNACSAARLAGVHQVLVPRLAAVFSAYGISFSDIAQSYETSITGLSPDEIATVRSTMQTDAGKDMFQEGHDLSECELEWSTIVEDDEEILSLTATFSLPHPTIANGAPAAASAAVAAGTRQVRSTATQIDSVSVYRLDDQIPGATAAGPAIVEGPFFTTRVPLDWTLTVSPSGDLQLTDTF
jgi:N-methylhydantoinase A/oxoprolinase/acetone carboxylase beta subunit